MRFNFKQMMCLSFIALTLCLGMNSMARAQETTGSITGTVRDAAGGAIAGATVTITDQAKGNIVVRTLTTNEDGEFTAPNLPVAIYQIAVEATNFKKSINTDVKLDVGQHRTVDVGLEPGNISEVVTVEADPVAVDLQSATAGTLINGDQVRELSLNNRNFVQLVTLAPGVTNDLEDLVVTGTNNPETQSVNRTLISVNGSRATQNTFTVDGADVTDRGSNLTIQAYPSVDSIGEFKVLRSLYPAESGRSGGGQINVVTRSGGEDFHGSAFEFVRNEVFNANSVSINNLANPPVGRDSNGKAKRRPFRYNNYGFTIGGPVYFFNFGESDSNNIFRRFNNTFFFFSEEQRRDIRYPSLSSIVPNTQLKQGVFPIDVCLRATISGTTRTCLETLKAGTPISSAGVPLSGVAQQYVSQILNNIPNPTNPATFGLDFAALNKSDFRQEIIKIDHKFTDDLSGFYRYQRDKIPTLDADGTFTPRSGIPFVNTVASNSPGRTHSAQLTYTISPNLIIEARYNYGFGQIFFDTVGLIANDENPIPVNLPYSNVRGINPIVTIGTFNSLTGFGDYDNFSWKKNAGTTLTWISGAHTMKFGAIYSRYRKNENALGSNNQGTFNGFNNTTSASPTQGSVLAPGVATTTVNTNIQAFANFLQGNNVTFTQSKLDLRADLRSKAFEAFVQDDWRIFSNLTMSAGVRYSYFGLPYDENGQLTNFVPELWDPAQAPLVTGQANRVAGSGNFCNGLIVNAQNYTTGPAVYNCRPTSSPWGKYIADVSELDFAPRIGFAWDPFKKGRTAIRTGYGIYHEQVPVGFLLAFFGRNPPYQESISLSNTTLDQPLPTGSSATVVSSLAVPSLQGVQPNFKTPYMQHWSLDWQQQVTSRSIFSVGYYGSKGTHLTGFTEYNELQPGVATRTQCIPANSSNTLQTTGAATVTCLTPGTAFQSSAATNILDQVRPFRGYRSINILETRYNSNYHSLQVSGQQRFSGASQVNLAYTWSKNLTDNPTSYVSAAPQNSFDLRSERGRAPLDRTHVLTVNYVYEIPYFSKQNNLIGKVLGGWQTSGIVSYATGLPLTVTTSNYDPAGLGLIPALIAGSRPNQLCDPNENAPHTIAQWFDTSCFQPNPATGAGGLSNTPGTAGRGIVVGPATRRVDLALSKNIRFTESLRAQFRMEAFNAFNWTQYRGIGTNISTATYGQVISFRDPRTIQFGLKLYF